MNEYSNKLIRMLIILTTLFMIVAPLNNLMLNYCFRIPALLVIVLFILNNLKKIKIVHKISIFIFSFIFLFHFIVDTSIDFSIFLSVISVISLLLLIAESDCVVLNLTTIKILNRCSIISAFTLFAYALSPLAHQSIHDGVVYWGPYLTFGYDNSNYAGIIALLIYFSIYVTKDDSNKFNKYLCFILELVLIYLIFKTNSRTALVAAIFIPFLQFLLKKRKLPALFLYFALILPFLFVPFYIYLGQELGSDGGEVMGKGIMTGRDVIFKKCLSSLSDWFYIMFGNFQKYPLANLHNGPLAILVSSGIIGLFFYFRLLFSQLIRAYKYATNYHSVIGVYVILASLLNTSAEASLLLGGFPCITYFFIFYIFANSHYDYKRKN